MTSQARSMLGPPETTNPARSTLGPRAVRCEWATTTRAAAPYSWAELAARQGRRGFLGGPGAPALQGRWVLPGGSSHGSRPLHPPRGTPPAPFPGLTSGPSPPTGVTPALPEALTMTPSSGTGPGVTPTVQDLASLSCSREPLDSTGQRVFRLFRKFCPRGTGSPAPPLSGVDPTPRRGEETQDVLHGLFRGAGVEAGAGLTLRARGGRGRRGRRRRRAGRWVGGRLPIVALRGSEVGRVVWAGAHPHSGR